MAFVLGGLVHVGGGLWVYRTDEAAAQVNVPHYWAQSWPLMRVGDHVLRTSLDPAGNVTGTGVHVVTSASRSNATTRGGH